MSALLSELGGLTGGAASEALAFAAGFAAGRALEPAGVTIAQDAWHAAQARRLDPATAAEIAAEGISDPNTMADEASYSGYEASRFESLYNVTLTGPGFGQLVTMLNRGTITPADFTHGLRKDKLETRWDAPLADLANQRIPVPDLAFMVVRGLVPDAGILPVAAPTGEGNVPAFPVFNIDTVAEAKAAGWDLERFSAMVGRSGLSMGPVQAAQAFFRGILLDVDYHRAIAEGDIRNEWANAVREVSRQILTADQYAEAQVRGQATPADRSAGTARHGMSQADSDLLYAISGRGLNVHAITTGFARGGDYPGSYANVPEPYRSALERSLVREEFSELAYANRYNLPSPFVIRSLATTGEINADTATTLLLESGWKPDLVTTVIKGWYGTTAGGADKHVAKAQTQLWTTTHKSYIAEEITNSDATTALTAAGVTDTSVPLVLDLWNEERALVRKQLSPAEIVKSHAEKVINPATGVAWTETDAIVALQDRGYSPDAALNLLEI